MTRRQRIRRSAKKKQEKEKKSLMLRLTGEEKSFPLISAMLDRQVTELTNHREACSI